MKTIQQLISNSMQWSFQNNEYVLQSGREQILQMRVHHLGAKADFSFRGVDYYISKEGFWSPIVRITDSQGGEVLDMKKNFFGTTATLKSAGGQNYHCVIRNDVMVKMSFLTADETELLNYHLKAEGWKTAVVLNILNTAGNEIDLLMLIVLGAFAFKGIIAENTDATIMMTAAAG